MVTAGTVTIYVTRVKWILMISPNNPLPLRAIWRLLLHGIRLLVSNVNVYAPLGDAVAVCISGYKIYRVGAVASPFPAAEVH